MPHIDVCFSPEMLHLYKPDGRVVVVIDILRATTTIVTALANGAESIKPVAELEECKSYALKGYITAAERNGIKAEGVDMGNSPLSYMDADIKGKKIALTTTNGTQAIEKSKNASEILIGSFLNIEALAIYLNEKKENTLLLCSGWKGRFNIEDTVFAGAVVDLLIPHFEFENDSVLAAHSLYKFAEKNLHEFLIQSSHVKRLNKLNVHDDFEFCLKRNIYPIVPMLDNTEIVIKKNTYKHKTI